MMATGNQATSRRATSRLSSRLRWAGFLLGFALGGFFDGILLHQVLQWHHLLLGVERAPFQDIRVQILADGLFHALMYVIALIGLWVLWKARAQVPGAGSGRTLLAQALVGFGVWHVLDSILSHWILGIHRIRMDVENVLFWDLLWFFVFGVAFIVAAWLLGRSKGEGTGGAGNTGSGGSDRQGSAAALALALAVMAAGPVAALPPKNLDTVLVFFKPGTPPNEIFRAIDAAGARVLWAADGGVWALDLKERRNTDAFYKHGAYLVSNSLLGAGCLAWTSARS